MAKKLKKGKKEVALGTQREKDYAAYDAAKRFHVEDLKKALLAGANAQAKVSGGSALLAAVFSDDEGGEAGKRHEVIGMLVGISNLEARHDSRDRSNRGYTALMHAAENGLGEAVRSLVAAGSDTEARSEHSKATALMLAARGGKLECVRELLKACDPDARDKDGWTALTWAARRGQLGSVELLLAVADPLAQDAWRRSAATIAKQCGHEQVASLLTAFEESVEIQRAVRALIPESERPVGAKSRAARI